MRKRFFDLQLFTDGGEGEGGAGAAGAGAGTAGNGNGSQNNAGGATYSYEQTEQIAQIRADRAEKDALADFFKRQGMSEDEVTAALADFRAKKAAQQPDVAAIEAIEKERDTALAQVEEMKNTNYLRDKGVKVDDLDYVLFKVSQKVDDKTDFKKAADAFLKENPRFAGQGYKVVSTGRPDGGSGTGQTAHDAINASIRSAFGR